MTLKISTKQFILRQFEASDAAMLAKNVNHRIISRNTLMIPYPYHLSDAKKWLNRIIRQYKKSQPDEFSLAIEIDNEPVGVVSLSHIEHGFKAILGYWLAKRYWGRGIMSSAVKEMTKFGFKRFELKRISANVFSFNAPSMKILEKNGFKREAFCRKMARKKGKFIDEYIYAKVR